MPRRVRADAGRSALRLRQADDRAGDRAQPRRTRAANRRWPTPRCSRRSPTPTSRPSWAATTSSSTCRRARCSATPRCELEEDLRDSLNAGRGQGAGRARRRHHHDRHPADADARALRDRVDERQRPVPGAQRRGLRRPRARTSSSTSTARPERLGLGTPTPSPRSRRAPPCSCTCRSRRTTSPRTGTPRRPWPARSWRSARTRRSSSAGELWAETRIELFPQATDTRSVELKNQGVRPRVFFGERWITSIFDLFEENVRYFPALLPGDHRRGPGGRARGRPARRGCRSCGCTTARSTAGTGRSTTSSAARRTCGWRTACCRPARPWSTSWPTPRSTTARCGCWPTRTARCGSKMTFAAAEDNFRRGRPARASTRCSTGRRSARCRSTSWCCGTCCPLAHEGLERWGVAAAVRDRYLGRHRAAVQDGPQRCLLADRDGARAARSGGCPGARRCTRCSRCTRRACTPTSRCTPGRCPDPGTAPAPATRDG